MKCLETGKVCPNNNFKCKVCKLEDCKNTIEAIEEEQRMLWKSKEQHFEEEFIKKYPQCAVNGKICSHLEVLNMNTGKVRCPYMINKKCVIGGNKC